MGFCTNCGNPLGDERFCTKCGAKVDSVAKPNSDAGAITPSPKNNTKNKGPVIGVATIFLIAAVVISIFIFGGRSYESVIKSYVTASMEGDAKTLVSLMPDQIVEYAIEEGACQNKGEMIADLDETLDNKLERLKDSVGEDYKVAYEITEEKDITGSDLEKMQDNIKEYDIAPKAVKVIMLDIKLSGNGKEETRSEALVLIKLGRSWYICGPGM